MQLEDGRLLLAAAVVATLLPLRLVRSRRTRRSARCWRFPSETIRFLSWMRIRCR